MPRLLSRFPFTLAMLALTVLAAGAAGTVRDGLTPALVEAYGYAACDLWHLRWGRLISSVFFTDGTRSLVQAVGIVGLACGVLEKRFGTRLAALTFWGLHFLALITLSLVIALPLPDSATWPRSAMLVGRDVGSSAGYFGCLAVVLGTLPGGWRRLAPAYLLSLVLVMGWTLLGHGNALKLTADLAHVLTFALGLGVASRLRPQPEH